MNRIILVFLILYMSVACWAANPFLRSKVTNSDSSSLEAARAVMIVLDCSGSMADPSGSGQTKMFAAKQVLEQVLSKINPDVEVGLRVYGSSTPSLDKVVACSDTVLLVPPGLNNRSVIVNKLRDLKPSGATPISLAMRRASEDLRNVSTETKSVVLISDGEDTCGYDPCTLAQTMRDNGVNIQFNVVGFGVGGNFNAINQLECIAKSTEGKFYTADTAAQLSESVLDGVNSYSTSVTGQIKEIKD